MKKFEFDDLQMVHVGDIYVVTYKDKIVTLEGKNTFSTMAHAKTKLQKVLKDNYHQGHYWHKGKDNTFSEEGGYMRNGGVIAGLDKIFRRLSVELMNELLNNGTFAIKKLQ